MTESRIRPWAAAAAMALALGLSPAGAAEWHVDGSAPDNRVEFTSEVVTFSFTGKTERVDGYLYWEGETLFQEKAQLLFEVDLASLDTGIGKRDRDMRDVLNTKEWPKARYTAQVTGHTKLDTTVTAYRVRSKGTLSLHGVEREMEIPATLFLTPDAARVRADFQIRLEDFDIEAPSLAAFVKVSQEIEVDVDFALKPAGGEDDE